ncbi:MAG: RIP metalloprotease RseP [Bacteroidetes bacterium]|nr:MAG: RIP metalloprotease RseP [Bacteroidota bacterium]
MDVLIRIAQFVLSLSILIVLHEMGHFFFARLFKTRVEKFYLFFDLGFSLFKRKIGDTQYGIGWLPLGGYVKISGMIDESMDREQMKQEPQPWEFRSKKAWQRLLIMLGGVSVNFLLALVIYILVFFRWGEEYVPAERFVYGYTYADVYLEMGFQNGDKILALDGKPVEKLRLIHHDIVVEGVKSVQIERNGKRMEIQVPEESLPRLLKVEVPMVPRIPFELASLVPGGGAEAAGLKVGDKILAIDGQPFSYMDELRSILRGKSNTDFTLAVLRGNDTLNMQVTTNEQAMLGVRNKDLYAYFEPVVVKYSLLQSIPAGIKRGVDLTKSYLKQLKMLFKPETKAYEEIGGFIKIGSIFSPVWDWQSFWNMTAFLSIILAVMNILPIPALDGGHVMFLLFEMITGRKPGDKFLEYSQIVGMVILLSLLLYANLNDIIGLFNK